MPRWTIRATVAIILALTFFYATARKQPNNEEKDLNSYWPPREVKARLDVARQHASEDELDLLMPRKNLLCLDDKQRFRSVTRLTPMQDGNYLALDGASRRIGLFGSNGQWVRWVVNQGFRIGEVVAPSDVLQTSQGFIVIADSQRTRLTILKPDLTFEGVISTIRSEANSFQAAELATGQIVISGYSQLPPHLGVHQFNLANGALVTSVAALDPGAAAKSAHTLGSPLLATVPGGRVLFGAPFEQDLHSLSPDGQTTTLRMPRASWYRPLTAAYRVDNNAAPKEIADALGSFRLSLTPLVRILALSSSEFLLQFESFDPLRYRIERWSQGPSGQLTLIESFKTNHFMAATKDGSLFASQRLDVLDNEPNCFSVHPLHQGEFRAH